MYMKASGRGCAAVCVKVLNNAPGCNAPPSGDTCFNRSHENKLGGRIQCERTQWQVLRLTAACRLKVLQ